MDPARLPGAHPADPGPLGRLGPIQVTRRVHKVGTVTVAGQKFRVGTAWAGQLLTVRVEAELFHVYYDGVLLKTVARTTVTRSSASGLGARPDKLPVEASSNRNHPSRHHLRVDPAGWRSHNDTAVGCIVRSITVSSSVVKASRSTSWRRRALNRSIV